MTDKASPSIVLDACRRRDGEGVPVLFRALFPESQHVKLLHSGTGPTGGSIRALTFSVQIPLTATLADMSTMIGSRAETWLNNLQVRCGSFSGYRNDYCMEMDLMYAHNAIEGILTLIVFRLNENAMLIHGRVCENSVG